jgi:hypothetical protein
MVAIKHQVTWDDNQLTNLEDEVCQHGDGGDGAELLEGGVLMLVKAPTTARV